MQPTPKLWITELFCLLRRPQIEREKLEAEDVGSRLRDERDKLERSSSSYENDNQELQRTIQALQQQIADTEHGHAQK